MILVSSPHSKCGPALYSTLEFGVEVEQYTFHKYFANGDDYWHLEAMIDSTIYNTMEKSLIDGLND